MKKVIIYTSSEGHLSIAEAIQKSLSKHFQALIHFYQEPLLNLYKPIYRYAPWFFKLPFQLAKHPVVKPLYDWYCFSGLGKQVTTSFAQYQPDLVISTYLLFNPVLEKVCRQENVPFINILTDPRSIHPLLISPTANWNLAFDGFAQQLAHKLSPLAKVKAIGWLVRPKYQVVYSKSAAKKSLQLDPNQLTFLFSTGSEGTPAILKMVKGLLNSITPLQILVACGHNLQLKKQIEQLATKPNIKLIPFGFTKELHKYMQAADLVIGKAGPNSIFEATATLTPFMATTHIHGQEDGNLEVIKQYHLGYVEENQDLALKLLKEILAQPNQLQQFKPHLQRMARANTQAHQQLLHLVKSSLKP